MKRSGEEEREEDTKKHGKYSMMAIAGVAGSLAFKSTMAATNLATKTASVSADFTTNAAKLTAKTSLNLATSTAKKGLTVATTTTKMATTAATAVSKDVVKNTGKVLDATGKVGQVVKSTGKVVKGAGYVVGDAVKILAKGGQCQSELEESKADGMSSTEQSAESNDSSPAPLIISSAA